MNNRSLSRGDAGVIGAAVLLFIFSFLDARKAGPFSVNGWSSELFPLLPSLTLAGLLGAGAIVGARFLPAGKEYLGLRLDQWGIALAVTSPWAGFWALVGGPDGTDTGVGLILGFLSALALAGVAAATPVVPALRVPLTSSSPAQPGQVGQPGQPYGGVQQPQQPQQGYGYPGGQPQGGYQQQAAPAQPAAPDPNFQPFWFAVPAARPLYGEDGSPGTVAELTPGNWYLAVEQRGQTLVAQTQDGRRGVLQDTSGIQRG
ncbi:DUF5336 domain-containing protein [Streptomyces sp. NBRC 109706]|uniref:DUF5336 domain-containing protein n=1 Tax=Streptomyces sp. NBRC 109706 TaxID=1550035 RepID=UPI000781AE4E|nr:DUF5336 domain-containing protein [Streptomyces sp. NBRC 109706]